MSVLSSMIATRNSGPPNSVDSLVFSRSPPKASQSLSLLGLMLANVKDLRKRTRRSYTSRGGSTSASGNTDCDLDDRLEVMSPRGRRVRRRKDSIPLSCSQENTVERHPGLLEWEIAGFINGGAAAEEDNVRPREDHADPDDGDVESNADEEEEEEGERGVG
ncbi:hypothetical protein CIB48_g5109 [Xylaria polymorpha]|nr:hypothetical protein CIB48_g5109 [Xylaria polymorpha]